MYPNFTDTRTHSSHALDILKRSHYDSIAVAEMCGFSGGLWVFWNSEHIKMKVVLINDQMMVMFAI